VLSVAAWLVREPVRAHLELAFYRDYAREPHPDRCARAASVAPYGISSASAPTGLMARIQRKLPAA